MPNTFKKISTVTVGAGGSANISFTSIPQTYTDLKIVLSGRCTADNVNTTMTFNGNTTGYSWRQLYATGASVASNNSSSYISLGSLLNSSTFTASSFGLGEIYISNYSGSTHKRISIDSVTETNASTSYINIWSALWSNTEAITSITITPDVGNFTQYSTATLYGIVNANTLAGNSGKAVGGNKVTTDGTYWYHVFTSDGTFTSNTSLNVDVLAIAGGGGGGFGGGGAGGIIYAQNILATSNTSVTVGAGGSGYGVVGGDSYFGSLRAFGGGGGSINKNGGSGGGADNSPGETGGSVTQTSNNGGTGYGNVGGNYGGSVNYRGAGGGGAGAAGKNNNNPSGGAFSTGGYGGDGLNTWSSWATATGTGVSGYYAGGGGAGAVDNLSGNGGAGGGGKGGQSGTSMGGNPKLFAVSGTTNTGSGGGGGGWSGDGYSTPGNGGSGIVIVRYLV